MSKRSAFLISTDDAEPIGTSATLQEKKSKNTRKSKSGSLAVEEVEPAVLVTEKTSVQNLIYAAASKVFSSLGRGHSESVYRDALLIELMQTFMNSSAAADKKIIVDREVVLPVQYAGRFVGFTRCDVVLAYQAADGSEWLNHVIELKAISSDLNAAHVHQALVYARQLNAVGGTVINFDQRDKKLLQLLAANRSSVGAVHSFSTLMADCIVEVFNFENNPNRIDTTQIAFAF